MRRRDCPVVHKPGEEYLSGIRLEGNTAIDSDDIIPRLGLQHAAEAQRAVDDYQLQLDTQRISTAFQKLGYFAVDVRSRMERKGGDHRRVSRSTQGTRATTHVEITGLPSDVPMVKARALVATREGAPFDYDAFDDAKDPMQRLLEDSGYVHAHVESSVTADRVHATATVRFDIVAGVRATFGAIEVRGVTGMLEHALRERITFASGDHYSTSAVVATQSAIYGLGLFATVRVEPDREGTSAVVAVKIKVTELTKNEASAGGGFGVDPLTYSGRLRGSYTRRDFFTPLTTLVIDARPEYAFEHIDNNGNTVWLRSAAVQARPADPRARRDDAAGSVPHRPQGTGPGRLRLPDGRGVHADRAAVQRGPVEPDRHQAAAGEHRLAVHDPGLRHDVFIDNASARALGIAKIADGTERTNYVGAYYGLGGARSARQADRADARRLRRVADREGHGLRGQLVRLSAVDVGGPRGFVPLGPIVIAARARYGTITDDVPPTERYFGGGASSQRGFAQRGLSPTASAAPPGGSPGTLASSIPCDPPPRCGVLTSVVVPNDGANVSPATQLAIGGAGLVESSIEVRGPLGKVHGVALGGVLFLDGGNVTNTAGELDVLDQFWAVGLGLRWLSPIGAVGLDIAYRLNKLGEGGSRSEQHGELPAAGRRGVLMRRTGRWIKRTIIGLVGVIVFAIVGVLSRSCTRTGAASSCARKPEAALRDAFPGGATIERIDGSILGTLTVTNLELMGRDGKRMVFVSTAKFHVELLPLFGGACASMRSISTRRCDRRSASRNRRRRRPRRRSRPRGRSSCRRSRSIMHASR